MLWWECLSLLFSKLKMLIFPPILLHTLQVKLHTCCDSTKLFSWPVDHFFELDDVVYAPQTECKASVGLLMVRPFANLCPTLEGRFVPWTWSNGRRCPLKSCVVVSWQNVGFYQSASFTRTRWNACPTEGWGGAASLELWSVEENNEYTSSQWQEK